MKSAQAHTSTPAPAAPPELYCPNCSMPRRRIHYNGEVWSCRRCRSWWSKETVDSETYRPLFERGGPAGFDPETGFESQAQP